MLLAEELLLLALDDDRGTVHAKARMALDFGLCAAMLTELTAAGRLRMDQRGRLTVIDGPDLEPPVLDAARAAIAARPGHDAGYWVRHLSRDVKGLRQRLLDGLVRQGTLQRCDQRILLLFHRDVFPEHDGRVEHDIHARLDAVLLEGQEADTRTVALVRLVEACGLLAELYRRPQRAVARKRLKVLEALGDDPAADAVDRAVRAQTAAMMAAVMAASVAATSAATSAACSSSSVSC